MSPRHVGRHGMQATARFIVGRFDPIPAPPPRRIFRGEDADLLLCRSCGMVRHRSAACPSCGSVPMSLREVRS
jgi:hypothetical protein